MTLEELINARESIKEQIGFLEDKLYECNELIDETGDGYFYFEYESVYGIHPAYEHLNADSASRSQKRYYGDNGFSQMITNNPNYDKPGYGQIVTLVNCSKEEAKRIFMILRKGEYEDYENALKPVLVKEWDGDHRDFDEED